MNRENVRPIKKKPAGRRVLILIAAVVIVLAAVLFGGGAKIRAVEVIGADDFDVVSVQRASGLRAGMKIKAVNEETVARNINATGYLSFVSLDIDVAHNAVLTVAEREACAVIEQGGMYITIDSDGYVISRTVENPHLVSIRNGRFSRTDAGMQIESTVTGLTDCVIRILHALRTTDSLGLYSVIDVDDTMSIILRTDSAMVIEIGSVDGIEERIREVKSVMQELKEDGFTAGTINATTMNISFKK